MQNGRTLNIVRIVVVRLGGMLRRMPVYVTVGIIETSNDQEVSTGSKKRVQSFVKKAGWNPYGGELYTSIIHVFRDVDLED